MSECAILDPPSQTRSVLLLPFCLFLLLISGCSISEVSVKQTGGSDIVLVDRDGKEWNITAAVRKYGMEVPRFEFGIGRYAITPLLAPRFLSPGDAGYPSPGETFRVIGVNFDGDVRAYGRNDIVRYEVVDEVIGDAHVAVAY